MNELLSGVELIVLIYLHQNNTELAFNRAIFVLVLFWFRVFISVANFL